MKSHQDLNFLSERILKNQNRYEAVRQVAQKATNVYLNVDRRPPPHFSFRQNTNQNWRGMNVNQ